MDKEIMEIEKEKADQAWYHGNDQNDETDMIDINDKPIDSFEDRLRKLREEKGLSQAETARRLNINRITYSQYEMGRRHPDYETLTKIADFFGTSVDYLLGRKLNDEVDVVDLEEVLESKTKKVTWKEKELTTEQRKALKELIAFIHDRFIK